MQVDTAAGATRVRSGLRDSVLIKRSGLSERRDKAPPCVLSRLHSADIGSGPRDPLLFPSLITAKVSRRKNGGEARRGPLL
jgi:hypothetical protein